MKAKCRPFNIKSDDGIFYFDVVLRHISYKKYEIPHDYTLMLKIMLSNIFDCVGEHTCNPHGYRRTFLPFDLTTIP